MRNKTIVTPEGHDPKRLLAIVEKTKYSFVEGRRNNDMVNWYVLKRLIDIEEGVQDERDAYDYIRDFDEIELTEMQEAHLLGWLDDWEEKIEKLHKYYKTADRSKLVHIWLPMDYDLDALLLEGQTALIMEG